MNTPQINLAPFCSKDETRPQIEKPYSQKEHTYATDGRICVQVARRADVPERPDAPPNTGYLLFFKCGPRGGFGPLPPIPEAIFDKCEDCSGAGKTYFCNPNRNVCREDCEHKPQKPTCPVITCESCDGSGKVERLQRVTIGDQDFAASYLRLVATLPNVRVAEGHDYPDPLCFLFDGGEGRLMGLRREGKVD